MSSLLSANYTNLHELKIVNHLDFKFDKYDNTPVFIDVVGWYYYGNTIRLNTGHKNYYNKLQYIKDQEFYDKGDKGYLAFYIENEWRFVLIKEDLLMPFHDADSPPTVAHRHQSAQLILEQNLLPTVPA